MTPPRSDHFNGKTFFSRTIGRRFGPPDLALVPTGADEPCWVMATAHLDPAEAVPLHRDIGSRRSIGRHWGTFQLTDEGGDEPVEALAAARAASGVSAEGFRIVMPGESVVA